MDNNGRGGDNAESRPRRSLDDYFGGVPPKGLIFAGTLLIIAGLIAVLLPDPSPISLFAFGGGLLGQGLILRRRELRDAPPARVDD